MPIQTGLGGLSTGKDVQVDVVLPSGNILRMEGLTDFDAKADQKVLDHHRINGKVLHGTIPGGWSLSWSLERTGPLIDEFFAALEANYYAGGENENVTVTETIIEPGGALSTWRFVGVALKYDDAGNWRADKFVQQKISGKATERQRVS